jgi:hypothetical protein
MAVEPLRDGGLQNGLIGERALELSRVLFLSIERTDAVE